MADYLKDKQYYIDLYDLHTIEKCLNYYRSAKKSFKEGRNEEQFKKYTDKKFAQEALKVTNFFIDTFKGERFKNKEATIKEWIEKDRKQQEKYDSAIPPAGILCKECNAPVEVTDKDLFHDYEEGAQVLFIFRCTKCNKRQSFYEDGTEWKYNPPKCPQCYSPLNSDYKDTDGISTTIYSCLNCPYKNEEVYDFKKSKLEWEQKEAEEKELLSRYRETFCLSDEEGKEFIEVAEALEVSREVYQEELQKYDTPVYARSTQLAKLGITELEKLLTEKLEKEGYTRLTFDKPEMGQQVIVPFTVQDASISRSKNISTHDLQKLIKNILEDTNWQLMSDGISYRLGYLYGRLKGYEGEEAMLELAGQVKVEQPPRVDSEKRVKYEYNNLVQLSKLFGKLDAEDNIRKRRLEKEPNGFAVPAGETYSCRICLTHIDSTNGWYDKHGFKCADCQRAANEGVLPPEVFEDDHSWYSEWHIESEYHIPEPTIKRLVKNGGLKPRIVTTDTGQPHKYVFLASENNNLLETYIQKHKIILLCGMPASGKTKFGKYLQDKHNYTYVSIQDDIWPDKKMQVLWSEVFDEKRQYDKVEKFVCYLHENYENVVLDWAFPINQIRIAELLKRQWCEIIWFTSSIPTARQRFIKNNKNSATYFDNQIKSIKENKDKILKNLDPKIIDVLNADRIDKTMEEIYSEYTKLDDPWI